MTLRTVLFWAHLTAGVLAGIVILIMSLTGFLLMYERQIIEWSDRAYRSRPPAPDARRLPLEALLGRVHDERGDNGQAATAVTVRADPAAPVTVSYGPSAFYVDAYSGRVLGQPTPGVRRAMSTLRSWHRWLSLEGEHRALAKAITGWSNLLFLFIVLSGMYLWIPRVWEWTRVKAVVFFRGGLRGKARDFNWHNVIGIWSAVPLALVVATATPISFPWANALIFRAVGEAPPAPAGPSGGAPSTQVQSPRARTREPRGEHAGDVRSAAPAGLDLDGLLARAEMQVAGWRSIGVRLPTPESTTVTFTIDRGNGGQPQARSTLTLDAAGNVAQWETFASQSLGRRLRSWSRFTHTGEAFGLAGQTVAGLVSAGGVVLVWTGLSLALRRFLNWISRKRRRADARSLATRTEAA